MRDEDIRGYLANQFGFSETGRYIIDTLIKPRIKALGITIINPFEECGKMLDFDLLAKLKTFEEVKKFWQEFSLRVTPLNNELMRQCHFMPAILDGGPAVDDGVCGEIGYFAGIEQGPIIALRSDFRGGENPAVSINPQILGYILQSKGYLVDGADALEKWFIKIQAWRAAYLLGVD